MKKNHHDKSTQGGRLSKSTEPILFELGAIAGLFFNEEGINELFTNDLLQIGEIKTVDNERANIIVGLSILTSEYFELRFVLTTTRGIERLSIYDEVGNLNSFQLKKWMHIGLCDASRKMSLVNGFPENYSFDSNHYLA